MQESLPPPSRARQYSWHSSPRSLVPKIVAANWSVPVDFKVYNKANVKSNISKRAYITCGVANCNTKQVVYMIQCKKCGQQYVGQTGQSLKERFKKHLQKIKHNKEANTLHKHFNRGACKGVHNMIVHILNHNNLSSEQIESELKRIELLWMDD